MGGEGVSSMHNVLVRSSTPTVCTKIPPSRGYTNYCLPYLQQVRRVRALKGWVPVVRFLEPEEDIITGTRYASQTKGGGLAPCSRWQGNPSQRAGGDGAFKYGDQIGWGAATIQPYIILRSTTINTVDTKFVPVYLLLIRPTDR